MRAATALAFICLLALVALAEAGEGVWFPLDVGWEWDYEIGGLESTRLSNVEHSVWDGNPVTVLRIEEPEGVSEFYVSGGDRSGFHINGARLETSIQGVPVIAFLTFQPPVPYVDPPLFVGKEWTAQGTVIIDVNSNVQEEPYTLEQSIVSLEDVLVPAGTFECFGFAPTLVYFAGQAKPGLFGTGDSAASLKYLAIPHSGRGGATIWFADGYGVIQTGTGVDAMRLSSWSQPTAVAPSSWGRIKSLY